MPSVVEFNFVDGKSGKITYTPPTFYMAATGYASCQTGQNTTLGQKWRAFFSFDTSSLPDNALIQKVEFLVRLNTGQPSGEPENTYIKFSIGTFIGAALNGTPDEFNGGTLMVTLTAEPYDNTWLDLNQDLGSPESYVNRAGDTDIKVWDDSVRGGGDASWGLNFNTSKAKCKLRITYTVPSATATGRGIASGAGKVTAAGSATATGRGTSQGAATVRAAGVSTMTGRGTAQLAAVVTAVAASTSTGRGSVQLRAVVGSIGSATATGSGSVDLVAAVIVLGAGVATGRGAMEIIAAVETIAVASATGYGTAFCEAFVAEGTASVTATGRGLAWCHLTEVRFDPLARHFGNRTVRASSAGVRSVSRVHAATRRCTTEDERLCGARRLN